MFYPFLPRDNAFEMFRNIFNSNFIAVTAGSILFNKSNLFDMNMNVFNLHFSNLNFHIAHVALNDNFYVVLTLIFQQSYLNAVSVIS